MEGIGSSHYRTPLAYRRSRTPAASGYRHSYRSRAPFKTQYVRRRDVKFDNKGVARLLNGIKLGNKRSDRQSDKIVVKGIKFIGNVQLGQDAKDEAVVHHVLFFVISDNSPSDSVPTPDKIFIGVGEGNPETWIVDPDQSDRFRMLKKMRFKLVGGKDKECVRHGIKVVDRFFPVDVWTDYKDTLLGNVGSIQKGAIYLVAATVSGKECKITLRSQIGGDESSDVDPGPSISEVGVSKEEVDRRGSVVMDAAEFSNVLRNVIINLLLPNSIPLSNLATPLLSNLTSLNCSSYSCNFLTPLFIFLINRRIF
ncbi:hypothetical protein CsSME_00035212 [Camellia sinensis var. sinensis]